MSAFGRGLRWLFGLGPIVCGAAWLSSFLALEPRAVALAASVTFALCALVGLLAHERLGEVPRRVALLAAGASAGVALAHVPTLALHGSALLGQTLAGPLRVGQAFLDGPGAGFRAGGAALWCSGPVTLTVVHLLLARRALGVLRAPALDLADAVWLLGGLVPTWIAGSVTVGVACAVAG